MHLCQLHQWSLWREERGAQWPKLPNSLQRACRDAFTAEKGRPSQLQLNLVREIRSRGFNVEKEHRCKTGYSIDALVTLKDGKKVAVEVDGPSHFVGNSQQADWRNAAKASPAALLWMASRNRALLGMGIGCQQ
jgi:hypothetical protein